MKPEISIIWIGVSEPGSVSLNWIQSQIPVTRNWEIKIGGRFQKVTCIYKGSHTCTWNYSSSQRRETTPIFKMQFTANFLLALVAGYASAAPSAPRDFSHTEIAFVGAGNAQFTLSIPYDGSTFYISMYFSFLSLNQSTHSDRQSVEHLTYLSTLTPEFLLLDENWEHDVGKPVIYLPNILSVNISIRSKPVSRNLWTWESGWKQSIAVSLSVSSRHPIVEDELKDSG